MIETSTRPSRRAILAGVAIAPIAAAVLPVTAMADVDGELLARVETFWRCHGEAVQAHEKWITEQHRVEALPDCPPLIAEDRAQHARYWDFLGQRGVWRLADHADELHRQQGAAVNAVFDQPARTIRGALEKLRIAYTAIGDGEGTCSGGDADLESYQDIDRPWMANVVADLERLAAS